MTTFMSKTMIACSLALAASLCAAPSVFAAEHQAKPAKSKAAKPKAAAESHPKAEDVIAEGPDADVSDTTKTDYNCELGNKITIFKNDGDDSHIGLRWKNHIHRLQRVGTTTGALRFENKNVGLIWIGIPSKGMLLDSKQNRQLANECKNAEQAKSAMVDSTATKKG